MTDEGVTRVLAGFCASFRFEDLPAGAVEETKRIILDAIGCGLGGHGVDKGRIGAELARMTGGTPQASIFGMKGRFPAAMAAFANGELMNALDWCPVMPPAHVPPFVLPPVLALAEERGKSGKDLLAAAALGMEVTGRLAHATGGLRAEGFPRRVWGLASNQVGGTAGAANLIGLDTGRMLHALGASGYFAPLATHVKFQHAPEQGYAKYGPSGWMAQGAVTTTLLAELGYHGDTTFLEGRYGYSAQTGGDTWSPAKLVGGLGQEWVFLNVGYKPWPTCGIFQSSLNLFADLIEEQDLQPWEMDEVVMDIEEMGTLPAYVDKAPQDHVNAASSAPYALAVVAHRIRRGPGMQTRPVIEDPRIRAFMQKTRIGVNPRCDELRYRDITVEGRPYPRHRPGYIRVTARGQIFERSADFCDWFSIDPAFRPSNEALAGKFRDNAGIILSPDRTERAIDLILDLEKLETLAPLVDALSD